MDIQLAKKPWYIKYRFYLLAGGLFLAFLVYLIIESAGPKQLRVSAEEVQIAEAKQDRFLEYVDVEGVLQPIQTIKVNTLEAGMVLRIVAEEGNMIHRGDTLLVLTNRELQRTIDDQRDGWEKQRNSFQEKLIEMEQRRLTLQQQTLQTAYELKRLEKQFNLDKEEFRMGIKSKAQLEVAEDEYNYKRKTAALQMESLRQDSAVAILRKEMLQNDLAAEEKKLQRSNARLRDLVVLAPIDGQLSYISGTPGQQIGSGSEVAEIKVLDKYKVHSNLSEYYIDKIVAGQTATVTYQGQEYPLRITKVVPEVKDKSFAVDMVFRDSIPDNARIGKSYQAKIELSSAESALIIPKGNFYSYTNGHWIFKVNASGTKATRVPISIGRQNPKHYEVSEGLAPGDRVLTTGYDTYGDAQEILIH